MREAVALTSRRVLFETSQADQERLAEISDLLTRFSLLSEHYAIDIERLEAIQESGSMFAYVEAVPCPLPDIPKEDAWFAPRGVSGRLYSCRP